MSDYLGRLKKQFKEIFSTQDSRFYLITATKFTLIPITSFSLVLYSVWTVLEMNYKFFAANNFDQSSDTFYDLIWVNIHNYSAYFAIAFIFIFLFGLFISNLALRAFDVIELHSFNVHEGDKQDLKVSRLNQKKLIFQVSRVFFKYVQTYKYLQKRPQINLPTQIEYLKSPPVDKVFLFQYASVVAIVSLGTSSLLFSFTKSLHQEIVKTGLTLLPTKTFIADFLASQDQIFTNIYLVGIFINILLYMLIAKNIIQKVDGVCYGFARDMIRVIKGKHHTRLKPRDKDPGQELARSINYVLDQVFPLPTDKKDFFQAVDETVNHLEGSVSPKFDSIDNLTVAPNEPENETNTGESQIIKMIFQEHDQPKKKKSSGE